MNATDSDTTGHFHKQRCFDLIPAEDVGSSMDVYGYDSISSMLELEGYQFKLLLNDVGVVLFPCTTEHRDAAQPGIYYADDYQGNALAAMVTLGRIEFRFHRQFTDQRVKQLVARMLKLPEFGFAHGFVVTYQARRLVIDVD